MAYILYHPEYIVLSYPQLTTILTFCAVQFMVMNDPFNFKNEKLRQMVEHILLHPRENTVDELAQMFGLTYDQVASGIRRGKQRYNLEVLSHRAPTKKLRPLTATTNYIPKPPDTSVVGIIGDTHEPFTLDGYREFCIKTFKKYGVTHVIHIGDLIDGHAWSYHESDPDGMGAGEELHYAKENVRKWVEAFPKIDVIWGNHDRLFMRKAFSSGIPREMMMDFRDVFGCPNWNFTARAVYDGVQYLHGEGGTARARCKKDLMSTVQGHLHPQAYTEWLVGETYKVFGMQVGCGVDRKAYAFGYAKDHPKPAIGVGIVADHGKQAFNVLMEL
jgi:predicted phosphodiesterase